MVLQCRLCWINGWSPAQAKVYWKWMKHGKLRWMASCEGCANLAYDKARPDRYPYMEGNDDIIKILRAEFDELEMLKDVLNT